MQSGYLCILHPCSHRYSYELNVSGNAGCDQKGCLIHIRLLAGTGYVATSNFVGKAEVEVEIDEEVRVGRRSNYMRCGVVSARRSKEKDQLYRAYTSTLVTKLVCYFVM
jgi:hypothetical protein